MNDNKSTRHLIRHEGAIVRTDRERLLGQRGCVVWLTGLSGSGKSTIARGLEARLHHEGRLVYVLDGDNIRQALNRDLGFSPEDRAENIRRIGEVAALFADAGVIVVAAFISPYRADRDNIRALVSPGWFFEVRVSAAIEVCEARDPKGLYAKARSGEIDFFTGISAPYEPPVAPELVIDTQVTDIGAGVDALRELLASHGIFEPPSGTDVS